MKCWTYIGTVITLYKIERIYAIKNTQNWKAIFIAQYSLSKYRPIDFFQACRYLVVTVFKGMANVLRCQNTNQSITFMLLFSCYSVQRHGTSGGFWWWYFVQSHDCTYCHRHHNGVDSGIPSIPSQDEITWLVKFMLLGLGFLCQEI